MNRPIPIAYIRLIFVIIWLLAGLAIFAQDSPKRYRVRAVKNIFYIPDTVAWGDDVQVYSPYLDSIMFRMENAQGYTVSVLTRTFQAQSTKPMQPGSYRWELIYREQDGIVRHVGNLFIK